jgi:predicted Zn-dependent protease
MPPHTEWSWVEAYGLLSVDPQDVHGDWQQARRSVEQALRRLVPADRMEAELRRATLLRDAPPAELLETGSGWAALEEARRATAGGTRLSTAGTPFPPETLGARQAPWMELLRTGRLPDTDHAISPILGHDWTQRLAEAPSTWQTELQLAYLARAAGDDAIAREHSYRSLRHRRTPWALRVLATINAEHGQHAAAAEQHLAAYELAPSIRPLALDAGHALVSAGRAGDALALVESLPSGQRSHGRVLLLEATAAAESGDLSRARSILRAGLVVNDVEEGERALHQLWRAVFPGEPLPYAYDFRMRTSD